MGKHKNKEKKEAHTAALEYISQPGVLKNLDISNAAQVKDFVERLDSLLGVTGKDQGYPGLSRQIHLCLDLTRNKDPYVFDQLSAIAQQSKQRLNQATHMEKRTLAYQLNLAMKQPKSISDFISGSPFDPMAPLGSILNPRILLRKRVMSFGPSLRTVLADTRCRPNSNDFVCDEAAGFYLVGTEESVIFIDKDELGKPILLLVVLRQVFGGESNELQAILKWFQHTIDVAASERRDVRPNHPGKMVQIGWNAGPRHARIFGLAKSFTKNLDDATKADHDHDAIAAANIVWGVSKAWLPTDIIGTIEDHLLESGIPRMATRHIPEGTGFRLELQGKTYSFPHCERAPPEAYLTRDYSASSHTDTCSVPGASAIAVTVGRSVDPPCSVPLPASGVTLPYSLRSSISAPLAEDHQLWPTSGGGNFVDISLKVVVKQAACTLLAFDPTKPHGTTRLCGAHNHIVAITFSSHIHDAFMKGKEKLVIEAGAGAGDGNFD